MELYCRLLEISISTTNDQQSRKLKLTCTCKNSYLEVVPFLVFLYRQWKKQWKKGTWYQNSHIIHSFTRKYKETLRMNLYKSLHSDCIRTCSCCSVLLPAFSELLRKSSDCIVVHKAHVRCIPVYSHRVTSCTLICATFERWLRNTSLKLLFALRRENWEQ